MTEGPRPSVLARLVQIGSARLGLIAAGAVGICAGGSAVRGTLGDATTPFPLVLATGAIVGGFTGYFARVVVTSVLAATVRLARWSGEHRALTARLRLPGLLAGALVTAVALGLALRSDGWRVDPAAVLSRASDAGLALLPAGLVLLLGAWAIRLTARLARRWPRASRYVPADLLCSLLLGGDLFLLFNRDLLTTQAAALLVFPAGIWFSALTGRAMGRSGHLLVRAGSDIVLSLLVGTDLVFLLVWTANVLDLPARDVAAVRETLERLRTVTDVPWWVWGALYAALAAASLAMALWPERLGVAVRWSGRTRLPGSIEAGRRTVTAAHVCLLTTSLIGLAAPPALAPALRDQVRARYAVALQQQFEASGERAAYEAIRSASSGGPMPAQGRRALLDVLTRVHDVAGSKTAGGAATPTERDLARRVGQVQASALHLRGPAPVLAHEQAAAELGRLERPLADPAELRHRLDRLAERQREAGGSRERLEQAAEQAAVAVASAAQVQIPGLGDIAVVQVIQEYLSGIVESSPVKEVFFEWAERLWFRTSPDEPPSGTQLAVPDPLRLVVEAQLQVTRLRLTLIIEGVSLEPFETLRTGEPPSVAAVDLVNETRILQARAASCPACHGPGERPGRPDRLRERPPIRPVEPRPGRP